MFHAVLSTPPWSPVSRPCPDLARLDAALVGAGSTPLRLDAGAYALEEDGDHYTRAAHVLFSRALAAALRGVARHPLVVADSTVDYHNWTEDGEWTGWASATLRSALGAGATVDAVCGSGFVARADHNEHFYTRIAHHLRHAEVRPDAVVVLGGWNDVRAGRTADACAAARACVGLADRFSRR